MYNDEFQVENKLNLTSRTELFVNSKRVELELNQFLSNQTQTNSTRLDSFPTYPSVLIIKKDCLMYLDTFKIYNIILIKMFKISMKINVVH
jgi:hypothetical protein